MASDTVVWAGLDFSQASFGRGSTNKYGFEFRFDPPEKIFPTMLEKWNDLFLFERIEGVSSSLRKRVLVDTAGVAEKNKAASAAQISYLPNQREFLQEPHISQQGIANQVRSYKMEHTNGLGLVFIVDRLIEPRDRWEMSRQLGRPVVQHDPACGSIYVVFFNIETREVISANREVQTVFTGGNFRNFWFGIIKDTDGSLRKYR